MNEFFYFVNNFMLENEKIPLIILSVLFSAILIITVILVYKVLKNDSSNDM